MGVAVNYIKLLCHYQQPAGPNIFGCISDITLFVPEFILAGAIAICDWKSSVLSKGLW